MKAKGEFTLHDWPTVRPQIWTCCQPHSQSAKLNGGLFVFLARAAMALAIIWYRPSSFCLVMESKGIAQLSYFKYSKPH